MTIADVKLIRRAFARDDKDIAFLILGEKNFESLLTDIKTNSAAGWYQERCVDEGNVRVLGIDIVEGEFLYGKKLEYMTQMVIEGKAADPDGLISPAKV